MGARDLRPLDETQNPASVVGELGKASGHSGRGADTGMDTTKIVPDEIEGQHIHVLLDLLTMGLGLSRVPPDLLPHGAVLPLDVGRTNHVGIRITDERGLCGSGVSPTSIIVLDYLGVIYAVPENGFDSHQVRPMAVCG